MPRHSACAYALAATLALAPLPASAQQAQPEPGQDPVVATVAGDAIRLSEVVDSKSQLPQQYQSMPMEAMFPALVERVIDIRLVAREARANGIADDPDVRRELAQIENQIISQVFLTRHIDAMITDEEVQARYDEHIAALPPDEEISARHILLVTEEDALAVIASLGEGADFIELAAEKSIGPSADRGGDIGYFGRGNVVPEFADAAFALEPGQTSETPVQSEFGWHVIKVDDRRAVAPPSLEEMREQFVTEISQQLIAELIGELRDAAAIECFNMDGSPKTEPEPAAEPESQPDAEPAP